LIFINTVEQIKNVNYKKSYSSGLSKLRNVALKICVTKFIIFLDDDVSFSITEITELIIKLEKGFNVVGLTLKFRQLPKKIYLSENQHHYIGLHANSTMKSNMIWGACMAFDLSFIQETAVVFDEDLDRQKNLFLSGGDTSFIQTLVDKGAKSALIKNIYITHNVSKKRLEFRNLASRIYWQGITETIRNNKYSSIKKEAIRNFSSIKVNTLFWSLFWYTIFLSGMIAGMKYKFANHKT
jgi:glycosyltransferase involved in cell wall biosynthesis